MDKRVEPIACMRTILIFFSFFLSISCIAQTGNSTTFFSVHEHNGTDTSFLRMWCKTNCIQQIISLPVLVIVSFNNKKIHHNNYLNFSNDFSIVQFDIISCKTGELMKYQVVKIVTNNSRAG